MSGWPDKRRRGIERRLRRMMAGAGGDSCSLCGRPFGTAGNLTHGGINKDGRVALVGSCCVGDLAEIVTVGVYAGETPTWQGDDAAWFKQHRNRTHRLRPAFPGELEASFDPALLEAINGPRAFQGAGALAYVAVRQIESGTRARMVCIWAKGSEPLPDSEEFAHALFDFLVEAGQQADGTVTTFDRAHIEALARRYQTGAPA